MPTALLRVAQERVGGNAAKRDSTAGPCVTVEVVVHAALIFLKRHASMAYVLSAAMP